MKNYSANVQVMVDACKKAGKGIIRDFYQLEKMQVSAKGPGDFTTSADLRAEEIIVSELKKSRPNYGFLREEAGKEGFENAEFVWVVDPIDGTFNFMHGNPCFCISLALCKKSGDDLQPVAGVIYAPYNQELMWAEAGRGAWFESPTSSIYRMRVSHHKEKQMLLGCSGSYIEIENQKFLDYIYKLNQTVLGLRTIGSTALSLAYVAMGRFDFFVQARPSFWDIAAGIILVKEAGGIVVDFEGNSVDYKKSEIFAANEYAYANLLPKFDISKI